MCAGEEVMNFFGNAITEELMARKIQPHILLIFMDWTQKRFDEVMIGERRLLLKEVVRMALFFDVPWEFIWNLSHRRMKEPSS